VLDKLRTFVGTLDDDERAVLAALLAPGVAEAYNEADDVSGFGMAPDRWTPERLPDALAARIRDSRFRIEPE
jgi:hypothetical protein